MMHLIRICLKNNPANNFKSKSTAEIPRITQKQREDELSVLGLIYSEHAFMTVMKNVIKLINNSPLK